VPTILHRARYGGHASAFALRATAGQVRFAHRTGPVRCEVICLPRKRKSCAGLRPIGTTGKSLLIIRNCVKPFAQKYSA
jgi:hypothetical protein